MILPEGKHKFSGIEPYARPSDYWGECEGYYIVIDDTVYAFERDPDDGGRSYGNLYIPENISVNDIKNRFPAEDVIITLYNRDKSDSYEDKRFYTIVNAETGKVILKIGTDYTESYYPVAICHYYPENIAINQQSSNVTDTLDNNHTNDWIITSTGIPGDYQVDENIAYIYN